MNQPPRIFFLVESSGDYVQEVRGDQCTLLRPIAETAFQFRSKYAAEVVAWSVRGGKIATCLEIEGRPVRILSIRPPSIHRGRLPAQVAPRWQN